MCDVLIWLRGGLTSTLLTPVLRQNPGRVDTVDFLCLGTRHFPGMILMILRLLSLIPTTLRHRSDLALENLALRQQLAVLNRRRRRPRLRKLDRFFRALLSRSWGHWKEALVIVKPETVLRWHRRRFASHWTRLSGRNGPGRPGKDREIRELIRKMAKSNLLWGAPRVGASVIECCWHGLKALYDKTLRPSLAFQVPVCRKTGVSVNFGWRCRQTSNNR